MTTGHGKTKGRSEDGETHSRDGANTDERASAEATAVGGEEGESEEEEETCGFCKYMKGGSCKETFVRWEKCVDDAKERELDFVDACYEVTSALRDCMLKDPEYYGPMTGENEEEESDEAKGESEEGASEEESKK